MKIYGGCPAMPSPGSARTAGTKMVLEINDPIADFRFRIVSNKNFGYEYSRMNF